MSGFLNFNDKPPAGKFDVMPAGTLAVVNIDVRETKRSKEKNARYFDLELTVVEPADYARKKIWTNIMDPSEPLHSEDARAMGFRALRAILEYNGIDMSGFVAETPEQGKQLVDHIVRLIDGRQAGIKVRIAKQDGYDDKNDVGDWLSPNPEASSYKTFIKLQEQRKGGGAMQKSQGSFAGFGNTPSAGAATGGAHPFGAGPSTTGANPPSQMTKSPSEAGAAAGFGKPQGWLGAGQNA